MPFNLGGFLKGAANTAVGLAPYAQQAMLAQKQRDDADKARMLGQLHQMSQDSTAAVNQTSRYALDAANLAHVNAETHHLMESPTSLTYRQDAEGNIYGLPTKMDGGAPPASNPLTAGPKVIGDGSNAPPPQVPGVTPIKTGIVGAQPLVKVQDTPGGPVRYVARDKAAGANAPTPTPKIDPNSKEGIAAAISKAGGSAAARAPYANVPLVKTMDPVTGAVTYTQSRQAGGMEAPKAGAGGGGGSLSPEDRQKMLNQAKLDHQTMTDYENQVLAGKKDVGTAAGVAGALSDSHNGVVGKVTGILANKATGAIDPDYQRYVTAQRSYGRIMGNLQSKRYTDNQAEIERSISGLAGNDLANTIRYKQQLRSSSLADPVPAQGGGRGGSPGNVQHPTNPDDHPGNINLGGQPTARPVGARPVPSDLHTKYAAAVAHLRAQGKTDAQIAQMLPPPPED